MSLCQKSEFVQEIKLLNLPFDQCMMGGAWFNELFGDADKISPSELKTVAMESIREQLNIEVEPSRAVSNIHKVKYYNIAVTCS